MVHLLGLDDLGAERATDWVGEQFFLMLNARYEARLPLFATTNTAPEELAERLTPRVMDRWRETCTVVEVHGKSLRGR